MMLYVYFYAFFAAGLIVGFFMGMNMWEKKYTRCIIFSPHDAGLEFPLHHKLYHGRTVICDARGCELFLMSVVRPSIEAREMLEDWAKAICNKFNGDKVTSVEIPKSALVGFEAKNDNGDITFQRKNA